MAVSEISIYIEDGWGDNKLSNRDKTDRGYFLHPSDNLISDFEAGTVLKGVYRPEQKIVKNDSNASVETSNSELSINMSDNDTAMVMTPSKLSIGSWIVDIYTDGSGDQYCGATFGFMSIQGDDNGQNRTDDCYAVTTRNTDSSGSDKMLKFVGGSSTSLITGSLSNAGYDTYEVNRSPYGDFEFFRNSNSQGTTVDRSHTESNFIFFSSGKSTGASHTSKYDNLEVK